MIKLPYGWDSAVQAAKEANGNGSLNNIQIAASIILELDSQLRSPAQPKTVADAVEYYKENGKICGYSFSQNKMLSFCKSNGTYCFVSEGSSAGSVETDDWQPICTREQFEAYVKEQEGERWTHTFGRERCYIKVSEEDCEGFIVIVTETDGYLLCQPSELKPIKPTMTEAQQSMVAKFVARIYTKESYHLRDEFDAFCNEHDII